MRKAGETHRRTASCSPLPAHRAPEPPPGLHHREPAHARDPATAPATWPPRTSPCCSPGRAAPGKELLARRVHRLSPRATRALRGRELRGALASLCWRRSCSATRRARSPAPSSTRPGLVESADGGTLFLDEVAEMPPPLQAKLLRMTEDRTLYRVGGRQRIRVDIRIVAATNRNLPRRSRRAASGEDLYYRLAGVEVAGAAAARASGGHRAAGASLSRVAARQAGRGPTAIAAGRPRGHAALRWPGNVRELRNLMERPRCSSRAGRARSSICPGDAGTRARRPTAPAPGGGERSLKDMERPRHPAGARRGGWHHGLPPPAWACRGAEALREDRGSGLGRPAKRASL